MNGKDFGPNLKEYLFQIGMSQRRLAKDTGLTCAAICLITNGHREPNLYTVVKILKALNVSLEFILIKERVT